MALKAMDPKALKQFESLFLTLYVLNRIEEDSNRHDIKIEIFIVYFPSRH